MIETKMKLERQKEEEFTEMAGDIVVLQNEKIIQTKKHQEIKRELETLEKDHQKFINSHKKQHSDSQTRIDFYKTEVMQLKLRYDIEQTPPVSPRVQDIEEPPLE